MRFKKIILMPLVMALALIPVNIVSAETYIQNKDIIVCIDIQDAYYYADGLDNIENDILSHFTLSVQRINNMPGKIVVNFYLLVRLTLPSGVIYEYLFLVTSPCECIAYPTLYLINHATESGWYCLEITGILNGQKSQMISGTERFDFDPPGGTDGTGPLGCIIEP
ncbi:MAG: hypothetical protein JXA54_00095 [Candidatus Heimdallarchaeota archaeon]|nr:hypothetical protein [Candidatus Heimdallarchaeota archaeon]